MTVADNPIQAAANAVSGRGSPNTSTPTVAAVTGSATSSMANVSAKRRMRYACCWASPPVESNTITKRVGQSQIARGSPSIRCPTVLTNAEPTPNVVPAANASAPARTLAEYTSHATSTATAAVARVTTASNTAVAVDRFGSFPVAGNANSSPTSPATMATPPSASGSRSRRRSSTALTTSANSSPLVPTGWMTLTGPWLRASTCRPTPAPATAAPNSHRGCLTSRHSHRTPRPPRNRMPTTTRSCSAEPTAMRNAPTTARATAIVSTLVPLLGRHGRHGRAGHVPRHLARTPTGARVPRSVAGYARSVSTGVTRPVPNHPLPPEWTFVPRRLVRRKPHAR